MANGDNGNGTKNWIMVVAILVALATSILSFARDTPTRDEMRAADLEIKQDLSRQLDGMEVRIVKRLDRIENKVDKQ